MTTRQKRFTAAAGLVLGLGFAWAIGRIQIGLPGRVPMVLSLSIFGFLFLLGWNDDLGRWTGIRAGNWTAAAYVLLILGIVVPLVTR